jgi:serine phosphatase RsbU (regulator of sigma subunit)
MKQVFPFLLLWLIYVPVRTVPAQSLSMIYDGTSGITLIELVNDTVVVMDLSRKGAAWDAGIRVGDRILSVNDLIVSGLGFSQIQVESILKDSEGAEFRIKTLRKGEDHMRVFHLESNITTQQFLQFDYLVDSLRQWNIDDILSDSINNMFVSTEERKIEVMSVANGCLAEEKGLRPGDRIISLAGELENRWTSISDYLGHLTEDTVITVLRGDTEIGIPLNPGDVRSFEGVMSCFSNDFSKNCVWLRIRTANRITKDRSYLLDFVAGGDTVSLFEFSPSGEILEKRTGHSLLLSEKDFVYKNWRAIPVLIVKGLDQEFYVRLTSESEIDYTAIRAIARESLMDYDRVERIVSSSIFGMMVLIILYYLILFASTIRKHFLFYSLFVLGYGFLIFIRSGYLDEIGNPDIQSVLKEIEAFVFSFISVLLLLFTISYLDIRRSTRWMFRIIWLNIALILFGIASLIIKRYVIQDGNDSLVFDILDWIDVFATLFIPYILVFIFSIISASRGFSPGWYLLGATFLLVFVNIVYLYTTPEFSSYSVHTSYISRVMRNSLVEFGVIFQFIVLSVGLGRKMRLDEIEQREAREKIIEQLKENEKLKDKVNRELEEKVRIRTREIQQQKEEIETQRDEIEAQRDELEAQRDEIEVQRDHLLVQRDLVMSQKKAITDSITYAQRIQSAVLPNPEYLREVMPDHFVLFKPRDIVSGDFYYVRGMNDRLVIVAADCTGHGVPGAFMSMLGIALLNEEVDEALLDDPGAILGRMRSKIKDILAQQGRIEEQKDGMDMAIAILDKSQLKLKFAGANTPLYVISSRKSIPGTRKKPQNPDKEHDRYLHEFKGDMQPIGIYAMETPFRNHEVQLVAGDTVYVFSDGFVDQFGGKPRRKFKAVNFKKLLLSFQHENMATQKNLLEEAFENWRGEQEQIDDVCVLGIRINGADNSPASAEQ